MIISGIWWLVILLTLFAIFLVLGTLKKPVTHGVHTQVTNKKSQKTALSSSLLKSAKNNALHKLHQQLVKKLPDYTVNIKKNHITIIKASKKLMMITLDKKTAIRTRHLGGVMVMNFHKAPSYKEIICALNS